MLRALHIAREFGVSITALAAAAFLEKRAMSRLLNAGAWPGYCDAKRQEAIRAAVFDTLRAAGAHPLSHLVNLFDVQPDSGQGVCPTADKKEDEVIFQKQALTEQARRAFGLFQNPFDGEVQSAEEMFQNGEFRYCREACWQAANHGRFVAVVGESGAGKTTLLGDLAERIDLERRQVILMAPSVLAMEDNDKTGKTLKASGIMDSIIYSLDRIATPRRTMEAKTRQLQSMLEASAKAGNKHLLVIEEAHALPITTLKHLKRLHELRMGRAPLLGILLLGQPELHEKLNENRHDVREVVQRCEVVHLQPLDADLKAYLATRCKRVGKQVNALFDDAAIDAMRARLTVQTQSRRSAGAPARDAYVSLVYPLAVNNFATACLNAAAALDAATVSKDVIAAV